MMIRIPNSWQFARGGAQGPETLQSPSKLRNEGDVHQTAMSLKHFCCSENNNVPWRKLHPAKQCASLHGTHTQASDSSGGRVADSAMEHATDGGRSLAKRARVDETLRTTRAKHARSSFIPSPNDMSLLLHFPKLVGSRACPASSSCLSETSPGPVFPRPRCENRAMIIDDDDMEDIFDSVDGKRRAPRGDQRKTKQRGSIASSRVPRSTARRKVPTAAGEKNDNAEKQFSLFGIGLLNRLEQQAVSRRRRLNSKKTLTSAIEDPSKAQQQQHHHRNRPDVEGGASSPPLDTQMGARDAPLQQKRRHASKYAFDQENLYNFAEARSAHCFPRQSAQEACQAIIDSIRKCNAHDASSSLSGARPFCEGACSSMEESSGEQQFKEGCSPEVNLDHILSCVPYKDMLQGLFVEHSPCSSSNTRRAETIPCKDRGPLTNTPFPTTARTEDDDEESSAQFAVPVVAKSYEESFMREPMWDYERPCMMGANCECHFISTAPGESFTGVEFLLPCESAMDCSSRRRERHMCVLCHRKLVQSLFYDIIYSGAPYRGIIQRYGNICNHAGEYAREVMLICPPNGPVECMPFPSVSHQRNKYSVYTKGGIRYIKQNRLSWEDFCQAPPSSAVP